jgi:hypothetical protein
VISLHGNFLYGPLPTQVSPSLQKLYVPQPGRFALAPICALILHLFQIAAAQSI